jgi:hypothetical protein
MLCSQPGTGLPRVCVVYELGELGSLSKATTARPGQLTAEEGAQALHGAALGLEALPIAGVVHCDVKPKEFKLAN